MDQERLLGIPGAAGMGLDAGAAQMQLGSVKVGYPGCGKYYVSISGKESSQQAPVGTKNV